MVFQPDQFLVSGESLVRNLQLGFRQAVNRRAHARGYVPDTFGHIAQLPQILLGFGIDNVVSGVDRRGRPRKRVLLKSAR